MQKTKQSIFKFSFFPTHKPYAEKSLRLGFQVSFPQNSFNIAIPYLLLMLIYYKRKDSARQERMAKKPEQVKTFVSNKWLRLGVDKYLGELAILLPLFKLWLIFEPFSIANQSFQKITFLQFLLKVSLFEMMFKLKIMGCGFYIHIPFYELSFIANIREQRNRKFFATYRS